MISACETAEEQVESDTNEQDDVEDSKGNAETLQKCSLSEQLTEGKEVMQTDRVLRNREGLKKPVRFENYVMVTWS